MPDLGHHHMVPVAVGGVAVRDMGIMQVGGAEDKVSVLIEVTPLHVAVARAFMGEDRRILPRVVAVTPVDGRLEPVFHRGFFGFLDRNRGQSLILAIVDQLGNGLAKVHILQGSG